MSENTDRLCRWSLTYQQEAGVPAVALVKRDQGRQPNSPAGWCRLRRRPDPPANESGRPIALDSRHPAPPAPRGSGRPDGQYRRGVAPPAPPPALRLRQQARRLAKPAAPGRPPAEPGSRAGCRLAGCPRRAAPDGGWWSCPGLVDTVVFPQFSGVVLLDSVLPNERSSMGRRGYPSSSAAGSWTSSRPDGRSPRSPRRWASAISRSTPGGAKTASTAAWSLA